MTIVRRTLTNIERRRLSDWRRKKGIHRRMVSLTDAQLTELERLGYLDCDGPGGRGDPEAEAEALQLFIDERLE